MGLRYVTAVGGVCGGNFLMRYKRVLPSRRLLKGLESSRAKQAANPIQRFYEYKHNHDVSLLHFSLICLFFHGVNTANWREYLLIVGIRLKVNTNRQLTVYEGLN